MPSSEYPPFDPDATLDEFAGVGKNRRFDQKIDDAEDEEIQVIYKRGDKELPLAKPSRAVYFGDRGVYDQEATLFDEAERADILNSQDYARNDQVFGELRRSCRNGIVVPFIGAGMSVGAGCKSWRQYLLDLAGEATLDVDAITARLEDNADYEGVTEDVIGALGQERFERDFERDFNDINLAKSAVALLPSLFSRCAVTTNFDRVAEEAWAIGGDPFREKIFARGNNGAFFRAIASGDHYILKLHGNLTSPVERVLRRTEYDAAYGADGNIHFRCALPKLLKRLYMSYSFLFLGCSLAADRTMQTFLKVAQQEGSECLPHHYAILGAPSTAEKKRVLDQRLADAHITPIWYPEDEHEYVADILQLLIE
jgi:SIR2-like domain